MSYTLSRLASLAKFKSHLAPRKSGRDKSCPSGPLTEKGIFNWPRNKSPCNLQKTLSQRNSLRHGPLSMDRDLCAYGVDVFFL